MMKKKNKEMIKKIAVSSALVGVIGTTGSQLTMPIVAQAYSDDIVYELGFLDEDIFYVEEVIIEEELEMSIDDFSNLKNELNLPSKQRYYDFSTDYDKYIQISVSKTTAIAMKNFYQNGILKLTSNGGDFITASTSVLGIAKWLRFSGVRAYMTKAFGWAGGVISLTSYMANTSVGRFASQIQSAVDKMDSNDRLVFRIESHGTIQDNSSCTFKLTVQKR